MWVLQSLVLSIINLQLRKMLTITIKGTIASKINVIPKSVRLSKKLQLTTAFCNKIWPQWNWNFEIWPQWNLTYVIMGK